MKLTVLAGGVGAARFLTGLVHVVSGDKITVIINTGDDLNLHGLYISPDVDIIAYTLAGIVNQEQGWGIKQDTYGCLSMLKKYGQPAWFNLGDYDLGTHIFRTYKMEQGYSLTQVTQKVCLALGVKSKLLPMCNEKVTTMIDTGNGIVTFEEYLVKYKAKHTVKNIIYDGIESASPAPGVVAAIKNADAVIIAPSNPLVSIGTILAVPGLRKILSEVCVPVIAISPIVGGHAIKGPAEQMLSACGYEVSAYGVAALYKDIIDVMIIDNLDLNLQEAIEQLSMKAVATDTIMSNFITKVNLARTVLKELGF